MTDLEACVGKLEPWDCHYALIYLTAYATGAQDAPMLGAISLAIARTRDRLTPPRDADREIAELERPAAIRY